MDMILILTLLFQGEGRYLIISNTIDSIAKNIFVQ